MTSKSPFVRASRSNSRSPSTIRPAYALRAISAGCPVEADPGRGHDVGVDVVEQVLDPQIGHPQVELAAQLAADQLRILGQEEDPLAGGQSDQLLGLHRLTPRRLTEADDSVSPMHAGAMLGNYQTHRDDPLKPSLAARGLLRPAVPRAWSGERGRIPADMAPGGHRRGADARAPPRRFSPFYGRAAIEPATRLSAPAPPDTGSRSGLGRAADRARIPDGTFGAPCEP